MQAWLAGNLQLFQDVIACQRQFLTAFQLSTAVGAQLDVLGTIIGQPRQVPFRPTPAFVSWSATPTASHLGTGYVVGDIVTVVQAGSIGARLKVSAVGGGGAVSTLVPVAYGSGYSAAIGLSTTGGSGTGLEVDLTIIVLTPGNPILDDATYRTLLQCQVFNNHWNGQIDSLTAFWRSVFPGGTILITDTGNNIGGASVMTATITFGGAFSQIMNDLIFRGYIVPRPEGVLYTYISALLPIFGFDLNTDYVAGFDIAFFS